MLFSLSRSISSWSHSSRSVKTHKMCNINKIVLKGWLFVVHIVVACLCKDTEANLTIHESWRSDIGYNDAAVECLSWGLLERF